MIKKPMLIALSSIFALSIQSVAFASEKPLKCPSISTIIGAGIQFAQIDPIRHKYVGITVSQYDTNEKWGFALGDFEASSPEEAVSLANASLQSISGAPIPVEIDEETDTWMCEYNKGTADFAVAFGPIYGNSFQNIIPYLHKH